MKINDIVSPEMVVPDLKGNDKPAVLRELAEHICGSYKEIPIGDLVEVLAIDRGPGMPAAQREVILAEPESTQLWSAIRNDSVAAFAKEHPGTVTPATPK